MHDIALRLLARVQQAPGVEIDQIRRLHVDPEQTLEGFTGRVGIGVRQPLASVVNDGAQTRGAIPQPGDEVEDTGFGGKVCCQRHRATLPQRRQRLPLAAIGDDHRMAVVEQPLGTVQPKALRGTGDQDRGLAQDFFSDDDATSPGVNGACAGSLSGSGRNGTRGA